MLEQLRRGSSKEPALSWIDKARGASHSNASTGSGRCRPARADAIDVPHRSRRHGLRVTLQGARPLGRVCLRSAGCSLQGIGNACSVVMWVMQCSHMRAARSHAHLHSHQEVTPGRLEPRGEVGATRSTHSTFQASRLWHSGLAGCGGGRGVAARAAAPRARRLWRGPHAVF